MNGDLVQCAIEEVSKSRDSYCKFMSANDSGETGGHQVGFLISLTAKRMVFTDEEMAQNPILKRDVKVKWQDDFVTNSVLTWYESKRELRLTRFGRGFPFIASEYTGALFILIAHTSVDYAAYILNSEDDIQDFLDAFGITPAETNRLIDKGNSPTIAFERSEVSEIDRYICELASDFPSSQEMAREARFLCTLLNIRSKHMIRSNPDKLLIDWTNEEYTLFRALEHARYGEQVTNGFPTVDAFVDMANMVLNRRKSRAGKSLEHHLAAIFDGNDIQYTAQAKTEGNKKPDFLFPSEMDYHNKDFSVEKLCTLAAKTTCKDRWRQVLNEADRLRDRNKFLCTMQQGISSTQMDEMEAERVILVVPKPYIAAYPRERQGRIWTIKRFIEYVKEMESV